MRLPRSWLARAGLALLLALLVASGTAQAAVVRGIVSHVSDGDTLWVRPAGGGRPLQVRLAGIDAPESCQRHGARAGQALRKRVLGQPVQVRTEGRDSHRRLLGRVRHRNQDLGSWLVVQGHAWAGRHHGRRNSYGALEDQARKARRGLWAQGKPMEPRHFRRSHGRCA